ncbi:Polysialic acid transport protein KpsM [compost metagenome]
MYAMLRSLWIYRGFVISSIRNEFTAKFARSKLGALWIIIHPLVQVAIYAMILSNVLAAKLPGIDNPYAYAIYLMAGILAWSLFAEVVNRCLGVFLEHGNLMKKIMFPRITLPAIVVGSSLMNNFFLAVATLGVIFLLGHSASWTLLWLIPLTALVLAFALGVGLVMGVFNVFMRDLGQVIPIVLQVLFWSTPIVYPATILPEWLKVYLSYNPMYPVVEAYHAVLVYGQTPHFESLVSIVLISVSLLGLGLFVFRKASAEMVDVL